MTQEAPSRPVPRFVRWGSTAFLVIALLVLGFFAGATVATRVLTPTGMGIDQMLDALGGAFLGAFIGLLVAVIAPALLSAKHRLMLAAAALAGVAICLMVLRVTEPNRPPPPDPADRPPHRPSFNIQLEPEMSPAGEAVSLLPAALPGVPAGTPIRRLQIGSNGAVSFFTREDPPRLCLAATPPPPPGQVPEGEAPAFEEIRRAVLNLPETVDCPPCEGCVALSLVAWLEEERRVWQLDVECWRSEPTLQPLRGLVEEAVLGVAEKLRCEES